MDEAEVDAEDTGPVRRCVATGQILDKAELIRFVVGPDGQVVPDVDAGLPGRGFWLSARRDVVNTAVAKKLFAKAARRQVTVPDGLADRLEALLVRRCLDRLGLARRAGQAVCGHEKVRAEIQSGRAVVLVQARDAALQGRERMRALAGKLAVIELFDEAELGTVFGREAGVHVCLSAGKLADRLIEDAARLAGFRDGLATFGRS
ncbi:MAG: RNA-binding protein [Actinomycetota bacterium]